jgi:hypothetical protein
MLFLDMAGAEPAIYMGDYIADPAKVFPPVPPILEAEASAGHKLGTDFCRNRNTRTAFLTG